MDFTWSEEQQAIRELSEEVLASSLGDADFTGDRFAAHAYAELARTELLSVGLATDHGGMGLGLVELLLLLRQAARHAAPMPLLETVVMASPLLQELGDPSTSDALLRSIGRGETIVTLALHERAKGSRSHVPYRNSLLTSVLRDSLGGNCRYSAEPTIQIWPTSK